MKGLFMFVLALSAMFVGSGLAKAADYKEYVVVDYDGKTYVVLQHDIWWDSARVVPQAFLGIWNGAANGSTVQLPLGWQSWPKADGRLRSAIAKTAKEKGVHYMSDTRSRRAPIIIQVVPAAGK